MFWVNGHFRCDLSIADCCKQLLKAITALATLVGGLNAHIALSNSKNIHVTTVFRVQQHPYQVRAMTAFSIHFFIVHHIKITIHLPYCNHKLVYNNNTKINYTLGDYVIFS